jgi:hypothetical protein
MGATVRLAADRLDVVPGAAATLTVTVRNTGTVVDQFEMTVLGDAAAWSTAEPDVLPLFPDAEGTVTIRFAPPRSPSLAAGAVSFGIRAGSHEDPAGSAVEEGTITVAPFTETFAELVPRTSHGSRSGTHELAVDNRGNVRLNATIEAIDPDQNVAFDVRPPGLVVEPGTAGISTVRVLPGKKFWRGPARTRPFKLGVASGPDQAPIMLDGSMIQEALLPRWFIPALLALLGALLLAAILWFTVLQPSIKSTAENAANDALVAAGIAPAPPAGGGGGSTPTPGATPAAGSTPGATAAPLPSSLPGAAGGGHPVDGRLSVDGTNAPGVTPKNTTLYLTDLVFANPNGRAGTLQLTSGTTRIMELRLENFRDLDFHFVTPILVASGQSLVLSASCTTSPCDPSVLYSGFTNP